SVRPSSSPLPLHDALPIFLPEFPSPHTCPSRSRCPAGPTRSETLHRSPEDFSSGSVRSTPAPAIRGGAAARALRSAVLLVLPGWFRPLGDAAFPRAVMARRRRVSIKILYILSTNHRPR